MITRTKLIVALACALSLFGLLGCGQTNHLQTIKLSASGSTGTVEVKGIGGTLQVTATGNYSNTQTHDLTNVATYTVTPTGTDSGGGTLAVPPQTLTISATGMATAVDPAVCTFLNVQLDPTKPASWVLTGSYKVIATFQGISSQPFYIAVASAAGPAPTGACGP